MLQRFVAEVAPVSLSDRHGELDGHGDPDVAGSDDDTFCSHENLEIHRTPNVDPSQPTLWDVSQS